MEYQNGNVSINAENIFPIIKKWLYSEKDIFIREVVSNANDAITKLKKLAAIGEAESPSNEAWKIEVSVDKDAGTITVFDNGIGMTKEEVEKYIKNNLVYFIHLISFALFFASLKVGILTLLLLQRLQC